MTMACNETFAFRADIAIGSRVVAKLVGQKSICHANAREPLLDTAIRLDPRADKIDVLLVRRQDVLAAGIAGIHHHLLGRPGQPLFDLHHSRNKIFVIRGRLPDIQADRDAMSCIGGDLDVVA